MCGLHNSEMYFNMSLSYERDKAVKFILTYRVMYISLHLILKHYGLIILIYGLHFLNDQTELLQHIFSVEMVLIK